MAESDRSLNAETTHKMLSYFNQSDPRIEVNPANVRIYARALGKFTPELITEVFDHYRATDSEDRKLSPGQLQKLCQAEFEYRERVAARGQIMSDPTKISFVEFKKRNPGCALAAYQEGYRQTHGSDDLSPPEWTRDDSSASILKSMSF